MLLEGVMLLKIVNRDILKKSGDNWWLSRSGPIFLMIIFGLCATFTFTADRWIVNLIYRYRPILRYFVRNELQKWKPVSIRDIWSLKALQNDAAVQALDQIYWLLMVVGLVLSTWVTYRWWRHFHVINHNEYGTAALATKREIKRSSVQVPDRDKEFSGIGGVPVAHTIGHNFAGLVLYLKMNGGIPESLINALDRRVGDLTPSGSYYINQDTLNVLVIGATRTGKGETIVNPTIDIISRGTEKASMIISDPKRELFLMSYKTLRRRGYDVRVLDLMEMNKSMSYNPLQAAIEFAKEGNVEKTQQQVNGISTAIYKKDKNGGSAGNEEFWQNSSISLLNALLLALIDVARRENRWEVVTLRNAVEMLNRMGSQQVFVDKDNNILEEPNQNAVKKSKLSVYFESLQKLPGDFRDQAFQSFQQSNFAGEETAGNVYSSAIAGINLYLQDDIARLTSKNSIDLTQAGFPRIFKLKIGTKDRNNQYLNQDAQVEIVDDNGHLIEKQYAVINETGVLKCPIKNHCPDKFKLIISFDKRANPSISDDCLVFNAIKIYRKEGKGLNKKETIDPYTKKRDLKKVRILLDRHNSTISQNKIAIVPEMSYSDKPLALFMVTPPNNPAYNIIVSFLIDQIFNLNYQMAILSGRKCYNRIHFILDEFGNIPAINDMDTKISIGLGQNILFDLIVQNLEQLTSKYGKEAAATIQSNCSTLIYILTYSTETAKTISTMVGKRTVNTVTNNGNFGNIDSGSHHNQRIGQELFSVDELMKFKDEEMLVFRRSVRRDKNHRKIESKPIYDTREMSMPYRWMNLQKTFNDQTKMAEISVPTLHLNLQLSDVAIDYEELLANQQELLHAGDGPNEELYDNNVTAKSGDQSSDERDIIFNRQALANSKFMTSMNQALLTYVKQSNQLSNLQKSEIEEDIKEGIDYFSIDEYNSYLWLIQILGDRLASEYKALVIHQIKQVLPELTVQ